MYACFPSAEDFSSSSKNLTYVPHIGFKIKCLCVEIPIKNDEKVERNEHFQVQLTIADSQSCVNITKENSTVLIVDDDECADIVEVAIKEQQYTVMEGDGEVEVCVEVSGGTVSKETIHVTLSTMDDTAEGK